MYITYFSQIGITRIGWITTADSHVHTAPANIDYRYMWPVGYNTPAMHDPHMELLSLYTPTTNYIATCIYNIKSPSPQSPLTWKWRQLVPRKTLLLTSKLKDWHGQGTWCVWRTTERLKRYSTPNRMESEVLEDRNCDGRMVLIKI